MRLRGVEPGTGRGSHDLGTQGPQDIHLQGKWGWQGKEGKDRRVLHWGRGSTDLGEEHNLRGRGNITFSLLIFSGITMMQR